MSRQDGGPAFPQLHVGPWENPYLKGGMTLRDYATIEMMAGLLASAGNNYWQDSAVIRRQIILNEAEQLVAVFLAAREAGDE